jgi:hypothetical protein
MNREDIIRMAREAGFPFNKYGLLTADDEGEIDADAMLERFAALVAAAEREVCAYKANIALLGADRGLANRVNQAIRNRT